MSYTLHSWGVYTPDQKLLKDGFETYFEALQFAIKLACMEKDCKYTYTTFLFRQRITNVLKKEDDRIIIGQLHDFGSDPTFKFMYKYKRNTLRNMKGGDEK